MTNTITVKERVPLSAYCTLGIGGEARYLVEVKELQMLKEALAFAHTVGCKPLIIGKGSNVLFDDRGYAGVVIINRLASLREEEGGVFVAGAGYSFSRLGVVTARQGWGGLEFASGIPGTVGGAVFMNAGANGAETCDTLKSVDYLDDEGRLQRYESEEIAFSYRTSQFQNWSGAIVSARFALSRKEQARQQQLKILDQRIQTQPYSERSAGCIFRNPPDRAAGALIEECGLKGYAVGGAAVSTLHGNFFINTSKASAEQMRELIRRVQEEVAQKRGVQLQSEVRIIPYEEL